MHLGHVESDIPVMSSSTEHSKIRNCVSRSRSREAVARILSITRSQSTFEMQAVDNGCKGNVCFEKKDDLRRNLREIKDV